jgi:hypothetical protein
MICGGEALTGSAEKGVQWPNYQHGAKNVVLRRHGNFVENDDYRKDGIALCVFLLPLSDIPGADGCLQRHKDRRGAAELSGWVEEPKCMIVYVRKPKRKAALQFRLRPGSALLACVHCLLVSDPRGSPEAFLSVPMTDGVPFVSP